MPRTILIHLNVEVPENDKRKVEEIVFSAISGALVVGSDDDSVRDLKFSIPLAEEI